MACCCCQGPGICCNGTECSSVNACECGANGGTFRKGATLACNPTVCQDSQGNKTIVTNPCACTNTTVCVLPGTPRTSINVEILWPAHVSPPQAATGQKTLTLSEYVAGEFRYVWTGAPKPPCIQCPRCNNRDSFACIPTGEFIAIRVLGGCEASVNPCPATSCFPGDLYDSWAFHLPDEDPCAAPCFNRDLVYLADSGRANWHAANNASWVYTGTPSVTFDMLSTAFIVAYGFYAFVTVRVST